MKRIFREIMVTLEPDPDAHELVDCMQELEREGFTVSMGRVWEVAR